MKQQQGAFSVGARGLRHEQEVKSLPRDAENSRELHLLPALAQGFGGVRRQLVPEGSGRTGPQYRTARGWRRLAGSSDQLRHVGGAGGGGEHRCRNGLDVMLGAKGGAGHSNSFTPMRGLSSIK